VDKLAKSSLSKGEI